MPPERRSSPALWATAATAIFTAGGCSEFPTTCLIPRCQSRSIRSDLRDTIIPAIRPMITEGLIFDRRGSDRRASAQIRVVSGPPVLPHRRGDIYRYDVVERLRRMRQFGRNQQALPRPDNDLTPGQKELHKQRSTRPLKIGPVMMPASATLHAPFCEPQARDREPLRMDHLPHERIELFLLIADQVEQFRVYRQEIPRRWSFSGFRLP